jgi:hypothetical protein
MLSFSKQGVPRWTTRAGCGNGRSRRNWRSHNRFGHTEAPRPACGRNDGRSPGSRVYARHRLPGGYPSGTVGGLAAYSCGGSCGLGTQFLTAFPVRSRKRDRRYLPLNGRSPLLSTQALWRDARLEEKPLCRRSKRKIKERGQGRPRNSIFQIERSATRLVRAGGWASCPLRRVFCAL